MPQPPNILLINACVRPESRTLRLTRHLLRHLGGTVREVSLAEEALLPLDGKSLEERDALLRSGTLDAPMLAHARAFAAAEEIVVAAPYWDLSFPSLVKVFFEHVTVTGVTFSYGADGRPIGHCAAKRLFYVMTAGGPILPPNHGLAYVRDLAAMYYGIPETVLFSAEKLDVDGMDTAAILKDAEQRIDRYFSAGESHKPVEHP